MARRETSSKSGLICRVKYTNTLPDIPFDSKSIKYPFRRDRFIKYKPTTLEKLCKVELHTDFDLGVNIDLINPETYIRPPTVDIDPKDNELLQEDDVKSKSSSRRSNIHKKQVTFFRASEYISQDFKQYGVSKEKTESRIDVKEKFTKIEMLKLKLLKKHSTMLWMMSPNIMLKKESWQLKYFHYFPTLKCGNMHVLRLYSTQIQRRAEQNQIHK